MAPFRTTAFLAFFLCGAPRARAEGPLTLEQVVERARQNDLRVKEADAELRLLEGRYTEARWAWFPKFETTVLAGGPTPEARNNGLGGPPTNPGGFLYDLNFGDPGFTTRLEITALLPLFTFGKLRALREAGRQGVAVGKDLKSRSQNEAAYQAAQAFFGYQLARQSRQSLADTRNRLEEANTLLKKLLEQDSAQVAQSDLNKLEFYRQQAEALAPRSEAGINLALAAVRVLLSIPPGQPVELASADLKEPELELKPVDFYLALAADHRPEFSAIRHGVAAREQEVLIRQRQFFPDFGIGGLFRFAYTSNTTRQRSPFAYDPYNSLNSGVGLVARASFDVPVKLAKLEQARAELDKLKVQESLLQSGVRLEVQKIYGDLNTALLRAKALSVGERNARRWFTAAYANFELGTTDTRELTESLIALAQVSGEKLQSWHDVSLGLYALARATGTDEARGSRVPNANETLNR